MKNTLCGEVMNSNFSVARFTLSKILLYFAIFILNFFGYFNLPIYAQDYLSGAGTPSFALPYPSEMGIVDAASGGVHLEFPLGSFAQRGVGNFDLKLMYDSHLWSAQPNGSGKSWWPAYYPGYLANGG